MVLYCIIQKLDYWPGLRSSAPPNWDFTIQYSLENWKVVKTMGDGRTSYTDEVSQRFLNLAMKKMTPNSGQTNGVKNMHLWHFWGFFGFGVFFFQVKKTTVLQNFNKTEGGKSGILHIYSFRMLEEADENLQGIHLVL